MTTTTMPSSSDFLRSRGLGDQEIRTLGDEFARRYRIAHRDRRGFDPGDLVLDSDLADRVLEEQTARVCRNCGVGEDQLDEDNSCLNCGCGTVDPADLPAAVRVASSHLPVTMAGTDPVDCGRCGISISVSGYRVEVSVPPLRVLRLCRTCAIADPQFVAWQMSCDVADAIDLLMQRATDQRQRDLVAGHLGHVAGWFSAWRWPDEQRRAMAQDLIDKKVLSGELIRLANGGLVAADEYDPQVHVLAECRDVNCGLVDQTVVHLDH